MGKKKSCKNRKFFVDKIKNYIEKTFAETVSENYDGLLRGSILFIEYHNQDNIKYMLDNTKNIVNFLGSKSWVAVRNSFCIMLYFLDVDKKTKYFKPLNLMYW
jgi:hypothetical protein